MSAVRRMLCLAGAGHVGAGLLIMLHNRRDELALKYGVDLQVSGVAEYGGCAVDSLGLDLRKVLATLLAGQPLGTIPGRGCPGMTSSQMVAECEADFLLEATPVNLVDGEPGLGAVRTALGRGMHVVLANKGPLALAYPQIAALTTWLTAGARRTSVLPDRGQHGRGCGSAPRSPERCPSSISAAGT